MSDTQERPVSQLVKSLRGRFLAGTTVLPTDVTLVHLVANALQASEEREQRLRALCDEYRDLAGFADIIRKFRAAITRNDSTLAGKRHDD